MHVHIASGDGEAKFWLEPNIELAKTRDRYSRKQPNDIKKLIEDHQHEFVNAWGKRFKDWGIAYISARRVAAYLEWERAIYGLR